jgi:hypothetical protein
MGFDLCRSGLTEGTNEMSLAAGSYMDAKTKNTAMKAEYPEFPE